MGTGNKTKYINGISYMEQISGKIFVHYFEENDLDELNKKTNNYIKLVNPTEIKSDNKEFNKNNKFNIDLLNKYYGNNCVFNLGLSYYSEIVISLANMINYIQKNNSSLLNQLNIPKFDNNDRMCINPQSLEQLNIKSLYKILNQCKTKMGSRKLYKILCNPYNNYHDIIN